MQSDGKSQTTLEEQDVLLIEKSESPGQAAEWISDRRGITFSEALRLAQEWMYDQEH